MVAEVISFACQGVLAWDEGEATYSDKRAHYDDIVDELEPKDFRLIICLNEKSPRIEVVTDDGAKDTLNYQDTHEYLNTVPYLVVDYQE
jgi:hypothetical protein